MQRAQMLQRAIELVPVMMMVMMVVLGSCAI